MTSDKLGGKKRTVLTETEKARLQRFERTRQNRRGRSKPAVVPADLARTSAFSPRRRGLVDDRNFQRVYVVPPFSVVEVTGRELGSQHRDALYALFRVRANRIEIASPTQEPNVRLDDLRITRFTKVIYETECTWRTLLRAMGRTEHVNNLGTLLKTFEEIREVTFRVYQGTHGEYMQAMEGSKLPSAGFSDNLLSIIEWDGINLDSTVSIRYGEWVRRMFEIKHLVSLNAEVYFKLKSDHAKSFWPYIDSQPHHTFIDDAKLAEIAGRNIAKESVRQRKKFAEDCRQAFDDMVQAGGLACWSAETLGTGRRKAKRYAYIHALPRQGELDSVSFI
jgi:hypothetical protein